MIAWGTCTVCLGVVNNYTGLLIVRIFLGVAEAGLYPGVAYYLTMWYCTSEMALRQGLFFSAASMAGAFSGLLAYAIAKMDGVGMSNFPIVPPLSVVEVSKKAGEPSLLTEVGQPLAFRWLEDCFRLMI